MIEFVSRNAEIWHWNYYVNRQLVGHMWYHTAGKRFTSNISAATHGVWREVGMCGEWTLTNVLDLVKEDMIRICIEDELME